LLGRFSAVARALLRRAGWTVRGRTTEDGTEPPDATPLRIRAVRRGARVPDTPPTAVVLAAGLGSRLNGAGRPKALVPLHGRPLLRYTLEGLAGAGVQRAVVVIGYRADEVQAALDGMGDLGLALETVRNPNFTLPNGSSLAAARVALDAEPFLLLMADHLLSAEAVRRVLAAEDGFAVGVDYLPQPPERLIDVTRVLVEDEQARAFGKQIMRWNAVDAGIFRCLPEVFDAVDAHGAGSELSAIMNVVASRRRIRAVDMDGAFWLDVDTPEDLAAAERLLSEREPR
jgi:1L-myo-inositol 1-phosphate cytidylyltransferase